MADEQVAETSDESGDKNPWKRIEGIVRSVIGEELGKWEVSQSDSPPSGKTPETPETPDSPPSSPKAVERNKGFLSEWFGIQ